ncbi:MAG: sulfatase-like hydrolase/transferase [bacterium]|nr:sulfatase-like hydrolase/transferase [bacterium]
MESFTKHALDLWLEPETRVLDFRTLAPGESPAAVTEALALAKDEPIIYTGRQYLQSYLSCVALVNDQVGKLLDALEGCSYGDYTIIVFTSDNGSIYQLRSPLRRWKSLGRRDRRAR